jgi:hypothetical protein
VRSVPDLTVDFMDMSDDRHLLTRLHDARPGFVPIVGSYAVVGDEDAEPRVAKVVGIGADGIVELEVLPGSVASHAALLAPS